MMDSEIQHEIVHGGPFGLRALFPRTVAVLIWLAFVIFPIVDAVASPGSAGRRVLTTLCAVAFIAGYCVLVLSFRSALMRERGPHWPQTAVLAGMMAVAALMTLAFQPSWAYLFCYCAGCSALLATDSMAFGAVALSGALAYAVPVAAGGDSGNALGVASGALGVGLLMVLIRDLRRRNIELTCARAELARLAVAAERERFGRDLHDLLGHSLSVIALKAELAGRLVEVDPARSAREVADIETVARAALTEVRDAVGGYRRPTLEGELDGARMALSAAGIECEILREGVVPDQETEAVLAWAVREGATNVVRHSTADHCVLRVAAEGDLAVVEVVDDGCPAAVAVGAPGAADATATRGGHGLSGLRERVAALHGTMAAGPVAGGGYRLSVQIPRGSGAA
jgi:two-component system, NarL family, sensor histidine kinase DesK